MVKHKDLIGSELHGARAALASPTRAPLFVGEIIHDGTQAWVATTDAIGGWRPMAAAASVGFGWVLRTDLYDGTLHSSITLYHTPSTKAQVLQNPNVFNFEESWRVGTQYTHGSPIDFGTQVTRRGIGCYFFAVRDSGGYLGDTPADSNLSFQAANPIDAIDVFQVAGTINLAGDFDNPWVFEIKKPFANVILSITDII